MLPLPSQAQHRAGPVAAGRLLVHDSPDTLLPRHKLAHKINKRHANALSSVHASRLLHLTDGPWRQSRPSGDISDHDAMSALESEARVKDHLAYKDMIEKVRQRMDLSDVIYQVPRQLKPLAPASSDSLGDDESLGISEFPSTYSLAASTMDDSSVATDASSERIIMPSRETKRKLVQLKKFIREHATRKVLAKWGYIRAAFGASGAVSPTAQGDQPQHRPLSVEKLFALLISDEVQCSTEEASRFLIERVEIDQEIVDRHVNRLRIKKWSRTDLVIRLDDLEAALRPRDQDDKQALFGASTKASFARQAAVADMERRRQQLEAKLRRKIEDNLALFASTFRELQPSRGAMNQRRTVLLSETLAYCQFIGRKDAENPWERTSHVLSIQLKGAVDAMKACIGAGKSLNGLKMKEAVELLQACCTLRIQTAFRRFRKSWRYFAARRLWRAKHRVILLKILRAWADHAIYLFGINRHCRRKLVAWRRCTKKARAARELYRTCFWPLFVWKRYARSTRMAREKTKLLCTRIYPTLLQLRVYRAWKRHVQYERQLRLIADQFVARHVQQRTRETFQWLRYYTRRKRHIRRAWYREGFLLWRRRIRECVAPPFYVLKAYSAYRVLTKTRHAKLHGAFVEWHYGDHPILFNDPVESAETEVLDDLVNPSTEMAEPSMLGEGETIHTYSQRSNSHDSLEHLGAAHQTARTEASVTSEASAGAWFVEVARKQMYLPEELQLPAPTNLWYISSSRVYVLQYLNELHQLFMTKDKARLNESAFLYQRYAWLAFQNLRRHAFVSTRLRVGLAQLRERRLRLSYDILKSWTYRKYPHLGQLRRKIVFEDHVDEPQQSRTRQKAPDIEGHVRGWKMTSLAGDVQGMAQQILQNMKIDRFQMLARQRTIGRAKPEATPTGEADVALLFDRTERRTALQHAENFQKLSSLLWTASQELEDRAEIDLAERKQDHEDRVAEMERVFETEATITQSACSRQIEYASTFKLQAAKNFLEKVEKVWEESYEERLHMVRWRCFRNLRLPWLLKRSVRMRNIRILRNSIRTCKRLICFSTHIDKLQRARAMWFTWNRWLSYLATRRMLITQGLPEEMTRRFALYSHLPAVLATNGITETSESYVIKPCITDLQGIFARWKHYTQESIVFDKLKDTAGKMADSKRLYRTFQALKSTIWGRNDELETALPTTVIRKQEDQRTIATRFAAKRRLALTTSIRRYNSSCERAVKHMGKAVESFKKFAHRFKAKAKQRIYDEQRFLLEAFQSRGMLVFEDIAVRLEQHRDSHEYVGDPLSSVAGPFYIKHVRVQEEPGIGLIGLQVCWETDGQAIEGRQWGEWTSGRRHGFRVPDGEFVVRIEFMHNAAVESIRVFTSSGTWSPWMGTSTSPKPQIYYLDAREHLGNYLDAYLIALVVSMDAVRIKSIGAVVRRVAEQNIFSYTWAKGPGSLEYNERLKEVEQKALQEQRRQHYIRSILRRGAHHVLDTKGIGQTEDDDKNDKRLLSEAEQMLREKADKEVFEVMRMRMTSCHAALSRAGIFARRVWRDRNIRLDPVLSKLSSLRIIRPLTQWFFNALAKNLVPPVQQSLMVVAVQAQIEDLYKTSTALDNEAQKITTEVARQRASKKSWASSGMMSPAEQLLSVRWNQEMDRLQKQADELKAQSEEKQREAKARAMGIQHHLPAIPLNDRSRQMFNSLVQLARYKHTMEGQMGEEEFTQILLTKQTNNKMTKMELGRLSNRES